jgi:hypothetical protein
MGEGSASAEPFSFGGPRFALFRRARTKLEREVDDSFAVGWDYHLLGSSYGSSCSNSCKLGITRDS